MLLALVTPDAQASDRAATTGRAPAAADSAVLPVAALTHDPGRGVPSLFSSPTRAAARPGMSAEAAARYHLERHRRVQGSSRKAIAGARLQFVHDTGRGGVIVSLRQRVGGTELFHGDLKVLLDQGNHLLAISGAPHPAAHPGSARPFVLPATDAVAVALRDLQRDASPGRILPTGVSRAGWVYYDLAAKASARLRKPARVKPVYFPAGDALLPAHFVELQLQGKTGMTAHQHVVAADDGRVLYRRDATANEAFQYRVHADADGDHRPFDGPMVDHTPHPAGAPTGGPKTAAPTNLITMEGFNTNPDAAADPWLPAGATETRGNNVDAYVDHSNPSGLNLDMNEFRADVTAPGVFDRAYDITKAPLADPDQSKAAITQLFYVVNWMHDWWYDSGFTEAAGNAQADNFGRGGVGGDPLLAEAQDAALVGTRNNANMSTLADGTSPVMQMYLWTPLVETKLTLTPLGQGFSVNTASFGPKNYDITAPLVLIEDAGGASTTDGCEAAVNDLAGKIVLIDRGSCTFETKSSNAQAAGAVGVLIANNADGVINMGADAAIVDPTIPTQGVLKVDGAAIKATLLLGPQTAHIFGSATSERDGTIDNMIVAHEWGHFIHHRLVDCGNNQCRAQSEGWGDFNALMMALRAGDDLQGAYGSAPYGGFDPTGYFGLRRVPYSVDTALNALSLRHIADGEALPQTHPLGSAGGPNSEVHNAGEVWATMMWEVYVALHEAHPGLQFEEVHRMMGDYMVAGMMLAPVDPTYTEMRDALLLAVHAADADDFLVVAGAFAKRGAGSCAVSPPRNSIDFIGVQEDLELRAAGSVVGVTLTDSPLSCDADGVVDVGELGLLSVEIFNHGAAAMPAGATITLLDPDPALVLEAGNSVDLGAVAPFTGFVAELPVALDPATVDHLPRTLKILLTTPGGCQETFETFLRTDFNGDVLADSSTLDEFETPTPVWTAGGTEEGDAAWSRLADPEGYVWHGADLGRVSDTWLASPTMLASEDEPLILAWDHAYSFEFSDNINWDGGLVEISADDGVTWEDANVQSKIAYTGAINSKANPLDTRQAFVDKNAAYPDLEPVMLDFGLAYAGKPVKLRFRIGTDAAAGAPGWSIDNFTADGIVNTPFSTWIADKTECVEPEETGSSGDDTTGDQTTGDQTTGDQTTSTTSTGTTDATDATTGTTEAASAGTDSTGDTSSSTGDPISGTSTGDTTATTADDTTGSFTTGDDTTGSFTTGTPGTGDEGPSPTSEPTGTPTEGPGNPDSSGGDTASSSGSDSEGVIAGDGCGCKADASDGRGWLLQLGPWFGLALLRRRRRASTSR